MSTETVVITHTHEGIRVAWPEGTSNVFANPVQLAEAYARSERTKKEVLRTLAETVNLITGLEKGMQYVTEPQRGDQEARLSSLLDLLTEIKQQCS